MIFVDDGSTDDSPQYLDSVAADHSQLRVIHQENSGWPGQPRNVGIDAAQGEYVFFCDNDDWLGKQALERLYDFASSCGSDVVLPKMAGIGRAVPYHVFVETVPRLQPGRLGDHGQPDPAQALPPRFPRRAPDPFPGRKAAARGPPLRVHRVPAGETISIYADYTCYFHIRREDSSNAGFRRIDWPEYFDNLAESLDGVVARTEPGPRPGADLPAMAAGGDGATAERRAPGADGRRRGRRSAGRRAAGRAAVLQRGRGRAPAADRPAGRSRDHRGRRRSHSSASRRDRALDRSGPTAPGGLGPPTGCRSPARWPSPTVTMGWPSSGSPSWSELTGCGLDLWDPELSWLRLDLAERRTGERWFVPATIHPAGVQASFTADLDPRRDRRRPPAAERPVGPERPPVGAGAAVIGGG